MATNPRPVANPRHAAFVRAYARTLSPSAAAVEAGYAKKSAGKRAWYLLRRPEIRDAIAQLQERRLAHENLSAARVLEELRRLAFADLRSLYREDGSLKDIHEWTAEQGSAVQEVSVQQSAAGVRVLKVRYWDKTKALEMLAKHYKLTAEHTEVSGGITISWLPAETNPDVVPAESVKRLAAAKEPA
jgi:phage terminase small subunit